MTRIISALGIAALAAAIGGTATGADDAATTCRAWHPHAGFAALEHGLHPDVPAGADARDPWTPHVLGTEPVHPWSPAAPATAQHPWRPAVPVAEPQQDVWHPGHADDCAAPTA